MGYKVKIGVDEKGKDFYLDFNKIQNIILRGLTGSGKSICLHTIIKRLLEQDKTLELILLDPKSVEFSMYAGLPNIKVFTKKDEKEIIESLNELNARKESLKKDVFVIIDELSDFCWSHHRPLDKPLLNLISNNKNNKVHILVASIPSWGPEAISPKIPDRIGFAFCSLGDSLSAIGKGGCEKLKGLGDCLVKIDGQITHVQIDWIREEIKEFVKELKETSF